ncbi:MAG: peptidoglycan-binding protein, partial [Minisyncoccia bacterium]
IDLVEAIKLNNSGGDSLELCTAVCNGTNQVDYVEWEDFSNSGLWNDDAGSGTGNSICRDGIIDTDTDADWSVTACNTDVTDTANDGNPGTGTYGTYDVTITASGVDTVVGESGPTSDTYTIVLESTPSATETVTIAIATDAQCSTDVTTVMFDTTNWNTPQTVTITAVDDALIETSPHTCAVTHTATSSNTTSRYHLLATDDINVDVVDNDSSIIATIPTSSKKKKASIKYTCKDESAQNYGRFGRHKQSLCIYAENSSPSVVTLDDLAENAQCPYFTQYHRAADTQGEVRLIQMFLNQYYNEGLDIDGVYGNNTQNAVSRFQTYWKDEVLTPWGLTKSTSRWYQSTKNKANEVAGCDEGRIQLDNGVYVD